MAGGDLLGVSQQGYAGHLYSPQKGAVGRPLYSLLCHIDHLASDGVSIVIYKVWPSIVEMRDCGWLQSLNLISYSA